LKKDDEDAIAAEIKILQTVDHPNIVKLKEIFDSNAQMFIVMEVMYGGELFDRIVKKEFYTEDEAKNAFKMIISSISYCHNIGVVHR
jgi:calcium/calmodulin-dependent protein kinase I